MLHDTGLNLTTYLQPSDINPCMHASIWHSHRMPSNVCLHTAGQNAPPTKQAGTPDVIVLLSRTKSVYKVNK